MRQLQRIPGPWLIRFCGILMLWAMVTACKKDPVYPDNPYDNVDYPVDDPDVYNPDPNSIVGIYENILRVKCANPGCHDGHFEPDYRSIQSSYTTLVYADVVKNTADSSFEYRVIPGDPDASMLWRRLTVDDAQLQQMPATGQTLTQAELGNIRTWIENGALDMFGNPPSLPNNEPLIVGFLAYNQNFTIRYDETENRLDSVPYNPFRIDANTTFNMVYLVEDDSTATCALQVNQLRMSLDKDNFAGAQVSTAFCLAIGGLNVWVASVNSGNFSPADTVYMRYYVNDGDQPFNTEFPRADHPDPYKTYSAFYVNP